MALILEGTYESFKTGNLHDSWKSVNDQQKIHVKVGINIVDLFNQKAIDEAWVNMVGNVSTGFIIKFVNSGGKDQVDL